MPFGPPKAPPELTAQRDALDAAIDASDMAVALKNSTDASVIAIQVWNGKESMVDMGFKGSQEDVADLLANLVVAFQNQAPGATDYLYRAICKLRIQEDAKARQRWLDSVR